MRLCTHSHPCSHLHSYVCSHTYLGMEMLGMLYFSLTAASCMLAGKCCTTELESLCPWRTNWPSTGPGEKPHTWRMVGADCLIRVMKALLGQRCGCQALREANTECSRKDRKHTHLISEWNGSCSHPLCQSPKDCFSVVNSHWKELIPAHLFIPSGW